MPIDIDFFPDDVNAVCDILKGVSIRHEKTGVTLSRVACYQLIGIVKELDFQLKQAKDNRVCTQCSQCLTGT